MTNEPKIKKQSKNSERGVALLFCLLALLILSAISASLILMSGTETSVNYNYRTEEVAFFAAKTGIYEALDRMQQSNANSIAANIPTAIPSATGGALYIINAGSSLTVQPWNSSNAYFDDEFCHEGYSIAGMTAVPPDVRCTTIPTGSSWYTTVTSNFPWSGTSAAMPYEWVRINWKQNNSQSYLSGSPVATTNYSVNSTGTSSTPVCWNGGTEVLLSTPMGISPAYTSCENYQSCGAVASPSISTPVLMITALAVTSNGSRQMVQSEVALNPPAITVSACGISDPYGFFRIRVRVLVQHAILYYWEETHSVDGYNSAVGPYATSHAAHFGSIGSNNGLIAEGSSTTIGGTVYVPNVGAGTPPGPGSCQGDDFSVTGHPGYGGLAASTPLPVPTVNIPANISTTDLNVSGNQTLVPNSTYRNVDVSGNGTTLTLTAPGTYNFNCLEVDTHAILTISPANKAVTINITGSSAGGCSTPLNMDAHATLTNSGAIAANLQINYPGTGTLDFTGGPSGYAVINAPNAAVVMHGGTDFYGTIMANSIDDSGGVNLHFDAADTTISSASATTATATANGSYNTLAFHSLPY